MGRHSRPKHIRSEMKDKKENSKKERKEKVKTIKFDYTIYIKTVSSFLRIQMNLKRFQEQLKIRVYLLKLQSKLTILNSKYPIRWTSSHNSFQDKKLQKFW